VSLWTWWSDRRERIQAAREAEFTERLGGQILAEQEAAFTERLGQYVADNKHVVTEAVRSNPELGVQALRSDEVLYATALNTTVMEETLEASRSMTRQSMQWPVLNQLGHGGRASIGQTLPKVSPFNLRRFSEMPPARRAINALCNPILDMPWIIELVAPIIPHSRSTKYAPPEPDDKQLTDIAIARHCLENPNDDESWRTFLEQILEDVVVGGYGAAEIGKTGDSNRPIYLWVVDGQSVRINTTWEPGSEKFRYSQSLGYIGQSIGTQEAVTLDDDELIYFKLNPRSNTPFGLGYLETAFMAINAWLGSFEYGERRASNATPGYGIFLGENVDVTTARRWQQYWEQEIEGYGKVPIIAGGRQPTAFNFGQGQGDDPLYIAWQEYQIRIIAMSFGLSPMKLGLERDVNRNTAETQTENDWETVAPIAQVIENYITRKLLWGCLGMYDLKFSWIVREANEMRMAEMMQVRWDTDSITADEIREHFDQPPMADGIGGLNKSQMEMMVEGVKQQGETQAEMQQLGMGMGGPPGIWEDGQEEDPVFTGPGITAPGPNLEGEEIGYWLDRARYVLEMYNEDVERASFDRVAT